MKTTTILTIILLICISSTIAEDIYRLDEKCELIAFEEFNFDNPNCTGIQEDKSCVCIELDDSTTENKTMSMKFFYPTNEEPLEENLTEDYCNFDCQIRELEDLLGLNEEEEIEEEPTTFFDKQEKIALGILIAIVIIIAGCIYHYRKSKKDEEEEEKFKEEEDANRI